MKHYRFSQHFGRTALALTTALVLTLPMNSAVAVGPLARGSRTAGDAQVNTTLVASNAGRLDGVAASLDDPARRQPDLGRAPRPGGPLQRPDHLGQHRPGSVRPHARSLRPCLPPATSTSSSMTLSYLTLDATDNWTADRRRPAHPRCASASTTACPGSRRARRSCGTAARALPSTTRATSRSTSGTPSPSPTNGVRASPRRSPATTSGTRRRCCAGCPAQAGRRLDGDLGLSHQGMQLGRMLRDGSIRPEGVGEWMRSELG